MIAWKRAHEKDRQEGETATRAEVLMLLKAEANKATDPPDKKQLQSLIALLEKDDHIPGSSAKPEGKV